MRDENQDIVGENCVFNDAGDLCIKDKDKMLAWEQHYSRLANVEFEWNEADLSAAPPTQGPAIFISQDMVREAINRLKSGKAASPSGVVSELIKGGG